MKALRYGEGNDHPHRPLIPAVHTYTRKVAELSKSEMVHIPTTIPFEH